MLSQTLEGYFSVNPEGFWSVVPDQASAAELHILVYGVWH